MSEAGGSLRRARAQGAAVIAVAFLAGLLVGSAVERVLASQRKAPAPVAAPFGPPGLPPGFERLGLTDDQAAAIHDIFARARPRTDSIMGQMLPRLRDLRDSILDEMRAVLTPEQLDSLEAYMEEWRGRREAWGMGRLGGGHREPPPLRPRRAP